jgi:apolipoprotein N-acyltransferase
LKTKTTTVIILLLIALFSFIFLGFTGFKVIFGILLVFFLPFYLILNNFNLSSSEKVIFSFFIGIGIFPAIVYWLGVLMSFKLAILITFVLLLLIAFIIKFLKNKQK